MNKSIKYTIEEIPKKSGGVRVLNVPCDDLKRLQRKLARLLTDCEAEIAVSVNGGQINNPSPLKSISHAFKAKHSTVTNARAHRNKKFVFNIDLKDFFPSINFGRVRGFFITNRNYQLRENIATLIAQICCHNNELPQGSPTSPIISNLIGNILDIRMAKIAKENKCFYTRYADDLTFSTSVAEFPTKIGVALGEEKGAWVVGEEVRSAIERCGFVVNNQKTRMQVRPSRQTITGLIVNDKINVPVELYKASRAMCHHLFKDGSYMFPYISKSAIDAGSKPARTTSLRPIEALLGYVHFVRKYSGSIFAATQNQSYQLSPNSAIEKLRFRLLFYKYFVANSKPVIICEGKTDSVYIKCAIDNLVKYKNIYSMKNDEGKIETSIHFLKYTRPVIELLALRGGSGDLKEFIVNYEKNLSYYKHKPLKNAVIILVDNDEGAKKIFSTINSKYKKKISLTSTDPFYHISKNLYLVKTLEKGVDGSSCIENLFADEVLKEKYLGLSFTLENEYDSKLYYGKEKFSQNIIKANAKKIDFSGFAELLDRVGSAIEDRKKEGGR